MIDIGTYRRCVEDSELDGFIGLELPDAQGLAQQLGRNFRVYEADGPERLTDYDPNRVNVVLRNNFVIRADRG